LVQTSAASVPKVVRDLEALDQTARGMVAPSEVEAVKTVASVLLLIVDIAEAIWLLVFVLIADVLDAIFAVRDVDAFVTSDKVAKEPEVRDAPVNVRVPLAQTSATNVPNEVRVLVALFQIVLEIVVVDRFVAPTTNVLSTFTKSPLGTLPQVIVVGQTPSGPTDGTE
jgi:hypothetical protein